MSEISETKSGHDLDVVVVGAGFAGLYALHRMRGLGLRTVVYEAGDGIGGTWYWNRYPGARCDAESLSYSYSFSPELDQEWRWTERYATQPEILKYIEHVADRFDLRRDIRLARRVTAAEWDDDASAWNVASRHAHSGEGIEQVRARFLIMATGNLSIPSVPEIDGLDDFAGEVVSTSDWPEGGIALEGRRVGVIGTGSSGIQSIPVIAEEAGHLSVFQRTPNFSVPAHNQRLDERFHEEFRGEYPRRRQALREGERTGFGDLMLSPEDAALSTVSALEASPDEVERTCQKYWDVGGARFIGTFQDVMIREDANEVVAEWVRDKIRGIVDDPDTAERLCPKGYPLGSKRLCVDTGYFATFNRPNVDLVDIREDPIAAIDGAEICLESGKRIELDVLVLATGFDAMTGALLRIDPRGRGGRALSDEWSDGPQAYLGFCIAGYPNLFTITGPGSPSVISNMVASIEQHVDLVADCIEEMRKRGARTVEADVGAQQEWFDHVQLVGTMTLFSKGPSWYVGANIPGKPRVFMPYAAGMVIYRQKCQEVVEKGWEGFRFEG